MMKKIFNVPADFKKETITEYKKFNSTQRKAVINETYGQLTEGYMIKSGRTIKSLPGINFKKLEEYVDFSLQEGIRFNYTLNPACLGNFEFTTKGEKEIKRLLTDLWNIGIKDLTISSPVLIDLVKILGFDFNMKVSAISHVDSITKLLFYKEQGINRVVIEPDLHRDFSKLQQMVTAFGTGIEIIINDICFNNCPYKIFHYNHEAHENDYSNQAENYFFMHCGIQKSHNFRNYLKLNWIRPEDIKFYEKMGIHNFKLQGRPYVANGDIIKTLMCYTEENYEGNLLELLHLFAPYDSKHQPYIDNKSLTGFIEPFYNNTLVCSELCDDCGYCQQYVEKAIKDSKELLIEADLFYHEQDQFLKQVSDLIENS